jgi:hypothetical protein
MPPSTRTRPARSLRGAGAPARTTVEQIPLEIDADSITRGQARGASANTAGATRAQRAHVAAPSAMPRVGAGVHARSVARDLPRRAHAHAVVAARSRGARHVAAAAVVCA